MDTEADRETVDVESVVAVLGKSATTLIQIISRRALDQNISLYLVGGVVRDLLLSRQNLDLDFVVESDASKFACSLAGEYGGSARIHPPFGTAKWVLDATAAANLRQSPDLARARIDFATAREETYASPAALPQVIPSTIERDLARRDFSINALALQLSPASSRGRIVDPHGGGADLENGLIRVLHDRSFLDDPTRVFRAVRLANRLNFELEAQTEALLRAATPTISRLSGDRIRHEIHLILREKGPERAIRDLESCGAFVAIENAWQISERLPELFARCREPPPPWQNSDHDLTSLYWHLLMMEVLAEKLNALCDRLTLTRELTESVAAFARKLNGINLLLDKSLPPSQATRLLDDASDTALRALWICAFDLPIVKRRIESFVDSWRHTQPRTDGNDLISLGLQPGPRFREILEALRDAWIDGDIGSEHEERELLHHLLNDASA